MWRYHNGLFGVISYSRSLPPPPLLSPPHPASPRWSFRRQQCCLGVIMCSQCGVTQHCLLHILPDQHAHMHTNADLHTRYRHIL